MWGSMDQVSKLKRKIHLSLIDLASIADDNDQILSVDIQTHYINSAGRVPANAILACDIELQEKTNA